MLKEAKENKIKNPDIIRSDAEIRVAIAKRIEERDLRYSDLIDYCEKKNVSVNKEQISRFLTSEDEIIGLPTQEAILCMCEYLDIDVKIRVELKKQKKNVQRIPDN